MSDPALTLLYEFAKMQTLSASRGLGPTLSFVRAGEATYFDAQGILRTAGSGVARFDHNPSAKNSLGLLIEEARTNFCLQSSDVVTAPWASIQTPVLTANDAISPRGTLEATLITDNNATNREGVQQSVVVPNNSATHATSIFVKKTAGGTSPTFGLEMVYAGGTGTTPVQIRLNTDTGETNGVGGGAAQDCGDYWKLWGLSTNNASGNTTLLIKLLPATAANGSFVDVMSTTGSAHAWGCQAELGSTPTSYIETFAVAVARNGDEISSADLSWLNTAEGTLFTDIIVPVVPTTGSGTPFIIAIDDGSAVDRILHTLSRETTNFDSIMFVTASSVNVSLKDTNANVPEGQRLRMGSAWKVDDIAMSTNGNAPLTNSSVTIPTGLTTLRLAAPGGTVQSNGHIREIRDYNVRKDNQFLVQLSNGQIPNNPLDFSRPLIRDMMRPIQRTF